MILTPRCKFRERDGEGDYSTLLFSSVSLKKQNSLVLFGLLLIVNYLIFSSDYFFFFNFFFLDTKVKCWTTIIISLNYFDRIKLEDNIMRMTR